MQASGKEIRWKCSCDKEKMYNDKKPLHIVNLGMKRKETKIAVKKIDKMILLINKKVNKKTAAVKVIKKKKK